MGFIVIQVIVNMFETVGIRTKDIYEGLETRKQQLEDAFGSDEEAFWKAVLTGVNDSRLKMTMESHVHAISDEDLSEADLSALPHEVIEWLKLNRRKEHEEDEEVVALEKTFHFQQFDSNQRTHIHLLHQL